MSSKREQVVQAIATTLAGTANVGNRIYRSRAEAFSRNESPAILIEPGKDRPSVIANCKIDWQLEVFVTVYGRGQIPDQVVDPVVVSLHSKLLADQTLGGLVMDLMPGIVDPQIDNADQPAVWMVCPYIVKYRTSLFDLTA